MLARPPRPRKGDSHEEERAHPPPGHGGPDGHPGMHRQGGRPRADRREAQGQQVDSPRRDRGGSTVVPGLSDIRVLVGRTYSDFLERREARPGEYLVQLDSVIGKASGRRAILPITLPKYGFQFGRIVGKGRPALPSPGSFPWGARGVKLGRFQRNARTRTASERSWSAPPRWVPGVTWQKNARAFLDFLNIPKFRRFLKGFLE